MNYSVDYFLRKFQGISNIFWTTGKFSSFFTFSHCALGHCKVKENSEHELTEEGRALVGLFKSKGLNVIAINDGHDKRFFQPKPKERILAALNYIKNAQLKPKPTNKKPNPKEKIRYVSVLIPESVSKQSKLLTEIKN